jgi:hypothetical protein
MNHSSRPKPSRIGPVSFLVTANLSSSMRWQLRATMSVTPACQRAGPLSSPLDPASPRALTAVPHDPRWRVDRLSVSPHAQAVCGVPQTNMPMLPGGFSHIVSKTETNSVRETETPNGTGSCTAPHEFLYIKTRRKTRISLSHVTTKILIVGSALDGLIKKNA